MMDVRCERCQTEYEFDENAITGDGVPVKCSTCGHVFRVEKSVFGSDDGDPAGATMVSSGSGSLDSDATVQGLPAFLEPPKPQRPRAREWKVRQANGNILTCRELTTLQKWIVERRVTRDDQISLTGESWKPLSNIAELASFFQVVAAADRAAPTAPAPLPQRSSSTAAWERTTAAPSQHDDDLLPDELALVSKGGGRGKYIAIGVGAALLCGAGYWFAFGPGHSAPAAAAPEAEVLKPVAPPEPPPKVAEEKKPEPAKVAEPAKAEEKVAEKPEAVPAKAEEKPAEPAKAEEKVAEKAPEPAKPHDNPAEKVAEKPAEKVAEKAPEKPAEKPAPAMSFETLLAQATHLREVGQVQKAMALYDRAAELDPAAPDALVGKGLCLVDLGNTDAGIALLEQGLKKAPRFSEAIMGLAEAYKSKGDHKKALDYYRRYLDVMPDGAESGVAKNNIAELSKE